MNVGIHANLRLNAAGKGGFTSRAGIYKVFQNFRATYAGLRGAYVRLTRALHVCTIFVVHATKLFAGPHRLRAPCRREETHDSRVTLRCRLMATRHAAGAAGFYQLPDAPPPPELPPPPENPPPPELHEPPELQPPPLPTEKPPMLA